MFSEKSNQKRQKITFTLIVLTLLFGFFVNKTYAYNTYLDTGLVSSYVTTATDDYTGGDDALYINNFIGNLDLTGASTTNLYLSFYYKGGIRTSAISVSLYDSGTPQSYPNCLAGNFTPTDDGNYNFYSVHMSEVHSNTCLNPVVGNLDFSIVGTNGAHGYAGVLTNSSGQPVITVTDYPRSATTSSNIVNITASSSYSNNFYTLSGNYFTNGTFNYLTWSSGLVFGIYVNNVLNSTTSVSTINQSHNFNSSFIVKNGYNNVDFGFFTPLGDYYSVKNLNIYYFDNSLASSTGAYTYNEFYSGLKNDLLTSWQDVATDCNFFNLISSSTFPMSQCLIDLAMPSTTTLLSFKDKLLGIPPLSWIYGVYNDLIGNTDRLPIGISATVPSSLPGGGNSISLQIDASSTEWLWNSTSSFAVGTAGENKTFIDTVEGFLNPIFYLVFFIYVLSFFMRAFGNLAPKMRSRSFNNTKLKMR